MGASKLYFSVLLLEMLAMSLSVVDIFRLASIVPWSLLVIASSSTMWKVLVRREETEIVDVFVALGWAVGLMAIGFIARWYLAANAESVYLGMYGFSTVIGCSFLWVVYKYQGGWTNHHG